MRHIACAVVFLCCLLLLSVPAEAKRKKTTVRDLNWKPLDGNIDYSVRLVGADSCFVYMRNHSKATARAISFRIGYSARGNHQWRELRVNHPDIRPEGGNSNHYTWGVDTDDCARTTVAVDSIRY